MLNCKKSGLFHSGNKGSIIGIRKPRKNEDKATNKFHSLFEVNPPKIGPRASNRLTNATSSTVAQNGWADSLLALIEEESASPKTESFNTDEEPLARKIISAKHIKMDAEPKIDGVPYVKSDVKHSVTGENSKLLASSGSFSHLPRKTYNNDITPQASIVKSADVNSKYSSLRKEMGDRKSSADPSFSIRKDEPNNAAIDSTFLSTGSKMSSYSPEYNSAVLTERDASRGKSSHDAISFGGIEADSNLTHKSRATSHAEATARQMSTYSPTSVVNKDKNPISYEVRGDVPLNAKGSEIEPYEPPTSSMLHAAKDGNPRELESDNTLRPVFISNSESTEKPIAPLHGKTEAVLSSTVSTRVDKDQIPEQVVSKNSFDTKVAKATPYNLSNTSISNTSMTAKKDLSLSTSKAGVVSEATPVANGELTQGSAQKVGIKTAAEDALSSSSTFVPRGEGIKDGAWNKADEAAVLTAQKDATSAMQKNSDVSKDLIVLGATSEELQALAAATGAPAYRAKQLLTGVLNGAHDLKSISTLPHDWVERLTKQGVKTGRSILHHKVAAKDGTTKFLLQLADGRVVETVGIPLDEENDSRLTTCVSSQVGCPMRCTFCATGKGGFARNLSPSEIVDQVLTVQEQFGKRVSNVVFMGMGEPLLNVPSVVAACTILQRDLQISGRSITISTVGIPHTLKRLAEHKLTATLAVSLHAPNQALRESLVPSAHSYPLPQLLNDVRAYWIATKRRVTFEYTLLRGVNASKAHATELAQLLETHRVPYHVNLIPYNPVDGSDFKRPTRGEVKTFCDVLEQSGLAVSVRATRGTDAAAACGQLRNSFMKDPLKEFVAPL